MDPSQCQLKKTERKLFSSVKNIPVDIILVILVLLVPPPSGEGRVGRYEYFLAPRICRWLLPGILLGPWSPSLGNVIFVPALQPGFTLIVKILSRILDV